MIATTIMIQVLNNCDNNINYCNLSVIIKYNNCTNIIESLIFKANNVIIVT